MLETLKFPNGTIINAKLIRNGNLCTIHPAPGQSVPINTSLIQIMSNGMVYGMLEGYSTVYRALDGNIILSNDGSVYEEPGPIPEPYVPTLDELKSYKKISVSAECERIIYAGVYVELPSGDVEHFSLTEKDQINLFGKQAQLAAGAVLLEYHQDGHPCRYYSAEEMRAIITAAMEHVSYHTTYCNSLNMWIAGAQTAEELDGIFYGADIPEGYQSEVLRDYLARIQGEAINAL